MCKDRKKEENRKIKNTSEKNQIEKIYIFKPPVL
jgi:hypothetical protein